LTPATIWMPRRVAEPVVMGSLAGESSAKKSPQIRLRVLTGSHALRVSRFGIEQEPTTCA